MSINYELLRGNSAPSVPTDGKHHARLERAKLVGTQNGERLVTEWSTGQNTMWTSWNRFDATGIEYTRELLIGLGADLAAIDDDEQLEDALVDATGSSYEVTTRLWGQHMDQVNTTVVNGVQPELGSDMPTDTRDLSPPTAPSLDDDIPF
jgi:hypothetical protein